MMTFILRRPGVIFGVLWGMLLFTGSASVLGYYPYSGKIIAYICIAIIVFFSTSFVGALSARVISFKPLSLKVVSGVGYINLYIWFMLASLVFICIDHILLVGANWWTPIGIMKYRWLVTEGGVTSYIKGISLFNYFFYTAIPLLITFNGVITKKKKSCIYFLLFLFVYLSASRSSFFLISLLGSWFYFMNAGKVSTYKVLLILLVLMTSFVLLGALTGKSKIDHVWKYMFSPIHGLDQVLNYTGSSITSFDLHLFRPVHSILYYFDVINRPESLLWPYVYTPYPVNVYTFFAPYILDFGIVGSLLSIAFVGFFTGYFCHKGLSSQSPRDKLIGALFLSMMILGVFHDYYFSSAFPVYIYILSLFLFPDKPLVPSSQGLMLARLLKLKMVNLSKT